MSTSQPRSQVQRDPGSEVEYIRREVRLKGPQCSTQWIIIGEAVLWNVLTIVSQS